ncbi:MAG: linear amide C-N hydrolase [Planctomycetota bacterium]
MTNGATRWIVLALAVVSGFWPVSRGEACTVMRLPIAGRLIIARNHDWPTGAGLVVVNQRGIKKEAISVVSPHRWTSTYGSVAFTQFGKEIPFAGMNERGLTVDLLHLKQTQFPTPNVDRESVNAIQWVQYQLDTAATVEDVVRSVDKIDPLPFLWMLEQVHYFVTDASGDSAVIEYIDGVAVVQHANSDRISHSGIPVHGLANSTWADSCSGLQSDATTDGSQQRFAAALSASQHAKTLADSVDPVSHAFEQLASVAQPGLTQWSLVYQPESRRIDFQTTAMPIRKSIQLDRIDFSPNAPTRCVDIHDSRPGELAPNLGIFDSEIHQQLVDASFDPLLPPGISSLMVKQVVLDYAETLKFPSPTSPVMKAEFP